MNLKFRTPVKCQNNHKAFWYWKPAKATNFLGIETISLPDKEICKCTKLGLDNGWAKAGDDQMFIGILSKFSGEIYHKDIVTVFGDNHPVVVEFDHGAFGYRVNRGLPWEQFISFCQNSNFTYDGDKCNEIAILGSTHLAPELIP